MRHLRRLRRRCHLFYRLKPPPSLLHHRHLSLHNLHRLRLQTQPSVNQHQTLFLLRHPCLRSSLVVLSKQFAVYALEMIMTFVINNAQVAIRKKVDQLLRMVILPASFPLFVSIRSAFHLPFRKLAGIQMPCRSHPAGRVRSSSRRPWLLSHPCQRGVNYV